MILANYYNRNVYLNEWIMHAVFANYISLNKTSRGKGVIVQNFETAAVLEFLEGVFSRLAK